MSAGARRLVALGACLALLQASGGTGATGAEEQSRQVAARPEAESRDGAGATFRTLTFDDQALFLLHDDFGGPHGSPRPVLTRIDRRTGTTTADARLAGQGSLLLWAGSLWLGGWSLSRHARGLLVRMDPRTLEVRRRYNRPDRIVGMAVVADRLWLQEGDATPPRFRMIQLDVDSGDVVAQHELGGYPMGLDTNANGGSFYLFVGDPANEVQKRDTATGALLASVPVGAVNGGGVIPWGDAVWISYATGLRARGERLSAADLRHLTDLEGNGDYNNSFHLFRAAGVLFGEDPALDGRGGLWCFDPGTGLVRRKLLSYGVEPGAGYSFVGDEKQLYTLNGTTLEPFRIDPACRDG